MKKTLTIGALCLAVTAYAQINGSVKGVITENGAAVEFVNAYLTLEPDSSKIIAGAVTDSLGRFQLTELVPEKYILHIQGIGYRSKQIPLSLTPTNRSIDLGTVMIQPDAQMLQSVEVTAMREMIQKTEEGFVMNANDNITQVGGTADDLLKNMPGVLVGADGEITLRGKSPLTLINGRVSGIAGIDRSAQLDRIPASSIDRIEIISNPSAKYDADAEGGIINIILKKSEGSGTNGAFAVGAGLGDRYRLNASVLLNHSTGNWNLGIAYDNWYTTRTRSVNGDRINFDLPDEYFLTQRRFDERLILYQNAKATADFTPNKYNTINFEALWAFPGEDNNETLKNTYETSTNDFTSRNQRHSNEIRRSHTVEMALIYTKHFDNPDKSFSANISDAYEYNRENTLITTQRLTEGDEDIGEPAMQRTHTYEDANITNVATDYAQPMTKNGTFETGYKGIFRYLNSDYERATLVSNDFIVDPLNSNTFTFNEQIHAAYGQYTGWTGVKDEPDFKYSLGLRAEQVWNVGRTTDETQSFDNNYFNLYPSANLFFYTKDRNNFKLSYSRRINRPRLGQLNPFVDITDSLNQHSGNPTLKPELIHSVEIGYYYFRQSASLSVTAFYRLRNNAIFSYITLDSNGVALSRPYNFGHAATLGLEAIAAANPYSFWNINFSISVYTTRIEDVGSIAEGSTDLVSWYTKLINNFVLFKNSKLQVVGNYTAPTAIPQGKSIEVYFIDIGFQQQLMKGKGRLGLVVTDVFNTQQSGSFTSDYNFSFTRTSKQDTRAIMVTFGYTFGTSFKENLMENRFKND